MNCNSAPNKALLFYLTWINPVVALFVLYACSWHSIGGVFSDVTSGIVPTAGSAPSSPASSGLSSTLDDPFSMYFVGKGVFCSTSLILFGFFFRTYLIQSFSKEPQHR